MDLDGELQSRLDLSKMDNEKTKQLMALDCLLLDSLRTTAPLITCAHRSSVRLNPICLSQQDEVSMMDTDAWNCIAGILSTVDHTRRPNANHDEDDTLGVLHVLLFGDRRWALLGQPNTRSPSGAAL